jgi:hypothetical protein
MPEKRPGPWKLDAARVLRKITRYVSISDLPDQSDLFVARAWLVGALRNEDHRAGAMALATLLREPLDQGLRRALGEELESVAQGKGRILKLKKSRKHRIDPLRDFWIAWNVWSRLQAMRQNDACATVDAAQDAVATESALGLETVRKAWQKCQRKLKLPV